MYCYLMIHIIFVNRLLVPTDESFTSVKGVTMEVKTEKKENELVSIPTGTQVNLGDPLAVVISSAG